MCVRIECQSPVLANMLTEMWGLKQPWNRWKLVQTTEQEGSEVTQRLQGRCPDPR